MTTSETPLNARIKRAARVRGRMAYLALRGLVDFRSMPPATAVDVAYQVMLGRHADLVGMETCLDAFDSGVWNYQDVPLFLRSSKEFAVAARFTAKMLGPALHASRCEFVRSLPAATTILDLGGTDLGSPDGALVTMGYPYRFDSLTIVDLPSEERHELYRQSSRPDRVETPLGPVLYRYHSMTDLSPYPDASVDLVYSGQSIEHVTREEAGKVLAEVRRVLRPGGFVAIDTPNARVTRLQQAEFVDPDHKYEYRLEELEEMIASAGLELVDAKGANYSGDGLAAGQFDPEEVARNAGLYWQADACYILCLVARRPAT